MSGWIDLTGRRALVSGGTKGVGEAVVAALLAAGATVMTGARSRPENFPKDLHFIPADLTSAAGCSQLARAAEAAFGGVDILVNVLGGSNAPGGGFAALGEDE